MIHSIHISDIKAFRQCRRRWNWSSSLRENLEPIVPYIPFFTGKAIHSALEFYYQDNTKFQDTLTKYFDKERENLETLGALWPGEADALAGQIDLIWSLVEHYILWQEQDTTKYSDENLEYISMEESFDVPLFDQATYGGRLDGLVKHKETGEYWIWETKTARSITELINTLANEEQAGAYIWAARKHLKIPIKGVLYNIIKKKAPTVPKMLQSGRLSVATNIGTSSYFYHHCIQQMFPDWSEETIEEEYGEFLEYLRAEKDSEFFMRFPIYRTEEELEMLMTNITATAKEMLDPNTAIYPCPSWNTCNFCMFRSACLTMNAGGNYQALLEGEFQVKTGQESMRSAKDD